MNISESRDQFLVVIETDKMSVLRVVLGVLVLLVANAYAAIVSLEKADDVTLELEPKLTGGFSLALIEGDEKTVYGHIGRTVIAPYTVHDIEGGVEVQINGGNLTVFTVYDEENKARGIKLRWDALGSFRFEDCLDFGNHHWYGGPMQQDQIYPIEKAVNNYKPYIVTDVDNGAIMERYWLNSAGQYIYVYPEVPLFVDNNNILANHLCFGAQLDGPYSSLRNHTSLSYDIWFLSDVKAAHKHAVATYLGKPSDVPDYRMVQHPIWSSWAQYEYDINQTVLLQHAKNIVEFGFNNSQFEIDDLWEYCYGSLKVDEKKFPNFTQLVQDIKDLGFRVTLWIHPFINKGCDPWYTEALEKGYFVTSENGTVDSWWWNPNGTTTGYVDFTNPEAAEWWYQRVKSLSDTYGIDSFKFDAGETNYAPEIPVQNGDIDLQPHHIVDTYVKTCARFGNMIEVRAGFRTQDVPIFVRMVDRDSIWGLNNGLPTIITTTLQMNLNGYTLVLPDMIGGNGFNLNHAQAALPDKELFIRWVEANAFLPAMQFSFAPWNFDEETVNISKKYAELHAEYADKIYDAMKASVEEGKLVNGPLWWIAPDDPEALEIWDEYLLGENILVAPVLTQGATTRDIYLPAGIWYAEGDKERPYEGPIWLQKYDAPLDTLPYFIRDVSTNNSPIKFSVAITTLVAGLVVNLFWF